MKRQRIIYTFSLLLVMTAAGLVLATLRTSAAVESIAIKAAAVAQSPWETAEGRACIEQWISYATARMNAFNGDANYNGNKPYSFNKYGVIESRYSHSAYEPDDFRRYNFNKYQLIWNWYAPDRHVWDSRLTLASVEDVRTYSARCLAGGTTSDHNQPTACGIQGTVNLLQIYSLGWHLGAAEVATLNNQDRSFVAQLLSEGRGNAASSGLPVSGFDSILSRLNSGASTRDVYNDVFNLRMQLQRLTDCNCNCAGTGQPPQPPPPRSCPNGKPACDYCLGDGIYNKWMSTGGQRGPLDCPIMDEADAPRSPQGTTGRYAEFRGGDGGYIFWHATGKLAGQAFVVRGCMFRSYKMGGNSGSGSWLGFPLNDEYPAPGGMRQDFEGGYILWNEQTRECAAHAGAGPTEPPACDISGTWRNQISGIGESTWTFTPQGNGRYSAVEQGLGNARGTAVLSGNRLRLDWTSAQNGDAGYYEWTLDRNCILGDGKLIFTSGRSGTNSTHIDRTLNPADYVRGNRLAYAVIPGNRSTPTDLGITLEKGKPYFLVSEGVIGMWGDRRDGVDSVYKYNAPSGWNNPPLEIWGQLELFNPNIRLPELIEKYTRQKPVYNPAHVYEAFLVGEGLPFRGRVFDTGDYGDNSNELRVSIYEAIRTR